MSISSKAAVAALVIIGFVAPCLAQRDSLPKIDLQKLCRQNDEVTRAVFSDVGQDSVKTCVAGEEAARQQITKDWSTFPPFAKSRCIRPNDYLPSYVEWFTCLEMTRDVIKARKEQSASGAAKTVDPDLCPVVKFAENGSIAWIFACDLKR